MTRILITGVRGKTGVPLAGLLAARSDVQVLGGSSDPSLVTTDGVSPIRFSWDDPSGWPGATAGVDGVYVVRPDRADAPELVAGLVADTPAAARVVLLSGQEAGTRAADDWALRVEGAVRAGGRSWTLLRPSWFAQVLDDDRFFRGDLAAGRLPFSGGGARVAWIDTRDIAAVAERALLDDGHDGSTYELSGPDALTLPETAQVLSGSLGRPITHVEIPIEEAVAGTTGFERQQFATTLERVHAGVYAEVTDTVERVTGRPARPLRAFPTDTGPVASWSVGGSRRRGLAGVRRLLDRRSLAGWSVGGSRRRGLAGVRRLLGHRSGRRRPADRSGVSTARTRWRSSAARPAVTRGLIGRRRAPGGPGVRSASDEPRDPSAVSLGRRRAARAVRRWCGRGRRAW